MYNCYIHIPFCSSKCSYCRFASVAGVNKLKIQFYVDFLAKQIQSFGDIPERSTIKTLYFGGGTPSVLSHKQLGSLFSALKKRFIFDRDIEITLESTPENITKENIEFWMSLGINRISVGIQTLNEDALREIMRAKKGNIIQALDVMQSFSDTKMSFSVDFILGLPFVKQGELLENIKYVVSRYTCLKHISVYMLEEYFGVDSMKESQFDEITYPNNWIYNGIDSKLYQKEYIKIKEYLFCKGFNRYEISNFSKKGFACKHNVGYWNHSECIAFGLDAGGFLNSTRYSFSGDFVKYYKNELKYNDKITKEGLFIERILFSIRTSGILKSDAQKLDTKKLSSFVSEGYLQEEDEVYSITDKGVLCMDYILQEII